MDKLKSVKTERLGERKGTAFWTFVVFFPRPRVP